MKLRLLFASIIVLFSFSLKAQECEMYFPQDEGTEMEIKNFDKKGNLEGSTVQKITSKEENGNNLSVTVDHESFDKKGESLMTGDFTVRCEDGIFYMDMKNMLNDETMAAYEGMEISFTANDLAYPSNMTVGSTLPDANLVVGISSSGINMNGLKINITNRKVEAKESITTEAGTFECYKLSFDIETVVMIKIKAKSIQWIAKDIGMVRTESYSKNGKLQGYSELTGLSTK